MIDERDVVSPFVARDLAALAPHLLRVDRKQVAITATGLGMLPEYSTSLPTGKADGKVWKARNHGTRRSRWLLAEYVEDDLTGKTIAIHWRELVVALPTRGAPCPT